MELNHYNSHTLTTGIELGPSRWEDGDYSPDVWHALYNGFVLMSTNITSVPNNYHNRVVHLL